MSEVTLRIPAATRYGETQLSRLGRTLTDRGDTMFYNPNFPDFRARTISDTYETETGVVIPEGAQYGVYIPRFTSSANRQLHTRQTDESRFNFEEENGPTTSHLNFIGDVGLMMLKGSVQGVGIEIRDMTENGHAASRLFRGILINSVSID